MKYVYIVLIYLILKVSVIFAASEELPSLPGAELKGTIFTRAAAGIKKQDSSVKPVAIIKDTQTEKVNVYEVGETVRGAKILEIARGEVVLEKKRHKIYFGIAWRRRKTVCCIRGGWYS
ncbi:MAG: hypothetical protein V2A72_07655 [Candidatus Omnitrophota bacterium]